jgi:hypothetical protein
LNARPGSRIIAKKNKICAISKISSLLVKIHIIGRLKIKNTVATHIDAITPYFK